MKQVRTAWPHISCVFVEVVAHNTSALTADFIGCHCNYHQPNHKYCRWFNNDISRWSEQQSWCKQVMDIKLLQKFYSILLGLNMEIDLL